MILAADPSTTRFGLALGGPDNGKPRAWTIKLPGAADNVLDRTLGNAADTIALQCRFSKVTLVAIEEPIIIDDRSAHTMKSLMQLTGAIRAAAHRSGCRVMLVHSSTVRRHFVGHGFPHNPKQAVMDRCRLLNWEFTDDNSADAAALWCYAMSITFPKWAPNGTPLFAGGAAA